MGCDIILDPSCGKDSVTIKGTEVIIEGSLIIEGNVLVTKCTDFTLRDCIFINIENNNNRLILNVDVDEKFVRINSRDLLIISGNKVDISSNDVGIGDPKGRGNVTIYGNVQIFDKLVAVKDIQLKTSGQYSEPVNLGEERGTRTVTIENGAILIHSFGVVEQPPINQIDIPESLKARLPDLEGLKFQGMELEGVKLEGKMVKPKVRIDYTYDLASEIFDLRKRVQELENTLKRDDL
jgi:hypothetical protein